MTGCTNGLDTRPGRLRAVCAGNVPSTPVRIAVNNAKQNNHGKSTAEQFPTRGKQGVNQAYQSADRPLICRQCGRSGRGLKQFVVKLELKFRIGVLGALHNRVVDVVIRDRTAEPAIDLTGPFGARCV
ncbi:hypothetical protein [Nitratireductor sp. StC3]|uniref:hypothetical protein n=1 Tax=Nitratireductor sp. StC3 TaxID=2126741 RepID=UPI0011B293FD|nr:hypothetical protein [Nitratireductor sp. StC3]